MYPFKACSHLWVHADNLPAQANVLPSTSTPISQRASTVSMCKEMHVSTACESTWLCLIRQAGMQVSWGQRPGQGQEGRGRRQIYLGRHAGRI